MAKETYKPKFEKTEANFLNEAKTLVEIKNMRNSSKAFHELAKLGVPKDDFKTVAQTGKMTIEVPQGTNLRKFVAIAVKHGMNEAREKSNYSALKKAFLDNKDTKKLEDNYALSFMLNEGTFNFNQLEESFTKKYEAFVKANGDKPQEFETYKGILGKCFESIENLSQKLQEKNILKVSEKGNFYLDANEYQKAELVELINKSNVEEGLDNAMKQGAENLSAYKQAVKDGVSFGNKAEEKSEPVKEVAEAPAEAEKPKRATKKAKA